MSKTATSKTTATEQHSGSGPKKIDVGEENPDLDLNPIKIKHKKKPWRVKSNRPALRQNQEMQRNSGTSFNHSGLKYMFKLPEIGP